ncbi:zinc ribbon domain-containing protein [Geomobilimonas luticola]
MACGCRFETLQKADVAYQTECPSCGSVEVNRELSTFSSVGNPASAAGCFSGG